MEAALMLEYPEHPNPPARPTRRSAAVIEAIADGLMGDVIQWLADDWREEDRLSILSDIIDALPKADGYSRAKYLEDRHHWSCDSSLVEILDSADGWTEERKAIAEWVEANGIRPKLDIGSNVVVTFGSNEEPATICNIDAKHALYTVRTDKWAKENPDQIKHAQSGILVPFERCKPRQ